MKSTDLGHSNRAFTIIEMMIVISIIGLLAAITYPSYREYLKRSKRTEGQVFLIEVAAKQERYFSQNNQYFVQGKDFGKLYADQNLVQQSITGLYTLKLETGSIDDGGYVLIAIAQFTDTSCDQLTLNGLGVRGYTGSAKAVDECWR